MKHFNHFKSVFRICIVALYLLFPLFSGFSQSGFDCKCPEGGKYHPGDEFPNVLTGAFSKKDKTFQIDNSCWDFGDKDQVPDNGRHYFDEFTFSVTKSGNYSFVGSDSNKLLIGIFKENFSSVSVCNSLEYGLGAYVDDGGILVFEEPKDNGVIDNHLYLEKDVSYILVLSDYDAGYKGNYNLSIKSSSVGNVVFTKSVFEDDCKFKNCYNDTLDYDFPLPEVPDNYSLTWTDHIKYTEFCGQSILTRFYTITDTLGNIDHCRSEYLFTGVDIEDLKWPKNWDGKEGQNPIIQCDEDFLMDENGNPSPDFTGYPYGIQFDCNTVEKFYSDKVYQGGDKMKVLRDWILVDDCTGKVYEHYQVIILSGYYSLEGLVGDDLEFKVKEAECDVDIEIKKLDHLSESCNLTDNYRVTIDSIVLEGDENNNNVYDDNEIWIAKNMGIGNYHLCYHVINRDSVEQVACVDLSVVDSIPPIASCEIKKDVSLNTEGYIGLSAKSFDSGSYDNCKPVFFKVSRVYDLSNKYNCIQFNKDDTLDSWFDDDVYFCCADESTDEVLVNLRVFDIDPGVGAINPDRMNNKDDLLGHFSDCFTKVKVKNNVNISIECPPVSVSCSDNLDPEVNIDIYPIIFNACDYKADYFDTRESKCSNEISRKWVVSSGDKTSTCIQQISVLDTIKALEPCTIVFPEDTILHCFENISTKPLWDNMTCSHVTAKIIRDDTFNNIGGYLYKINREWAIIDWCTYEENSGAESNVDMIKNNRLDCDNLVEDGYYRYTQVILIDTLLKELNCVDVEISCVDSKYPESNPKLKLDNLDYCSSFSASYSDEVSLGVCGEIIERTWKVANGIDTISCMQTIKVVPNTKFEPCSIVFPTDKKVNIFTDEGAFGRPEWKSESCGKVTAKLIREDTINNAGNYLYKINREWAVIDWCTYEENSGAESNEDILKNNKLDCDELVEDGYYRYTQVIDVVRQVPVEIISDDVCFGTLDCFAKNLTINAKEVDSCALSNASQWKYIVTNIDTWKTVQYSYNYHPIPNDGVMGDKLQDELDSTNTAKAVLLSDLPVGNYRVTWTLLSGCGTVVSKNIFFKVVDKKAPTPILVDYSNIAFEDGSVEIAAKDFDKGGCDNGCISSFDNCSTKNELYFTFSDNIPHIWEEPLAWEIQFNIYGKYFFNPETGKISEREQFLKGKADAWNPSLHTSSRKIFCDENLETMDIKVFVWDQLAYDDDCDNNNFDYGIVKLLFKNCGNTENIYGKVSKVYSGKPFNNMEIFAYKNPSTYQTRTDENGEYVYNLYDGEYIVSGENKSNYEEGVSTRDIIIINKYILGLLEETLSPYQYLAMDVNNDLKISATDILSLRKLLLKTNDRFKNSSWLAISKDFVFDMPESAYTQNEAKNVKVSVVDNDIHKVDFYAVKIGDIDLSGDEKIIPKADSDLIFVVEDKDIVAGELVEIPIKVKRDKNVRGFQFSMNIQDMYLENIKEGAIDFSKAFYNEHNDRLLFSYSDVLGKSFDDGEVLFTILLRPTVNAKLSNILNFDDFILKSEAYKEDELKVCKLILKVEEPDANENLEIDPGYKLYQNEPNPFSETTTIGFNLPKDRSYTITIFDLTGKVLKEYNSKGKAGYNSIKVFKKDIGMSGVYYYRLNSEDFTSTKKMVILK